MQIRIYVTGRIGLLARDGFVDDWARVGQQGRIVFCFLAVEHVRAISQDELAEEIWPRALPSSWERSLSALVSRIRAMIRRAGLSPACLQASFGCYQLCVPPDVWIDLDAAASGIDEAEGYLRMGDFKAAWSWAQVAHHIARRPFLPGADGSWATRTRGKLTDISVRAHDCLGEIYLWKGEPAMVVWHAEQAVALEPYRETSYQHLMRGYAAGGNSALAHRAYERCRTVLSTELGVPPSRQTQAVYAEVMKF
jgi:DNA-binding SARP family transcriptional activator